MLSSRVEVLDDQDHIHALMMSPLREYQLQVFVPHDLMHQIFFIDEFMSLVSG